MTAASSGVTPDTVRIDGLKRRLQELLRRDRPSFYAAQPLKRALVEALGVETGAAVYARAAGMDDSRTQLLTLRTLRQLAHAKGWEIETLASAREVCHPAPEVFRQAANVATHVTTRAMFTCVIPDAVVSSKSNFVVTGDSAVLDVEPWELLQIPIHLDTDPCVVHADGDQMTMLLADPAREPPIDIALNLIGMHSYAFGHWVLEFLPRLFAWTGRHGFGAAPILVDRQMPAQHFQALSRFAGAHPLIVLEPGRSRRVHRLLSASMPVYMPHGLQPDARIPPDAIGADPLALAGLYRAASPDLVGSRQLHTPGERIYLARTDSQHRRLLNRDDVERWARAQGFSILQMQQLDFDAQLERLQGAATIIGPDGSAFLSAFFARPGTRVGILNHSHLEDFAWYGDVLRALGIRLQVLASAKTVAHPLYDFLSDYAVDIDELSAFVTELESRD